MSHPVTFALYVLFNFLTVSNKLSFSSLLSFDFIVELYSLHLGWLSYPLMKLLIPIKNYSYDLDYNLVFYVGVAMPTTLKDKYIGFYF